MIVPWLKQFSRILRYTVVGFIALGVDFGTLLITKEYFHYHYLIAAALGFIGGFFTNYFLSMKFVFQDLTRRKFAGLLFFFIGLLGLLLNEFIIWIFTGIVLLHYLISKGIAVIIVFFWNYLARRYFCFKGGQ
jgi:putative flippase GtrA